MKLKDGALACAIAYIVINAIPWQDAKCLWMLYIVLVYATWELVLRIEWFWKRIRHAIAKRKGANGTAIPKAHR